MKITKPTMRLWDPAEHLQSDEDMAAYLEAALEEGDASFFTAALGDIAQAKGMSHARARTEEVALYES
jgi:probable addiction module antidote protein